MKQYYYTSCMPGRSLSGADGFGIRAASAGLDPARLNQVRGATADYKLPLRLISTPSGFPPEPEAFVRLSLIPTGEGHRLLCHSVPAGLDPSTGRTGNIFTHVLVDLPARFDPRQAILNWRSPFWRRADGDDFGTELPEVPPEAIHADPAPLDAELREFLQRRERRRTLRFLLSAVLLNPPQGRVFVVAPAPEVALYVWGITRALPARLRAGLTFSTHEQNPLNCPARIVGTWWGGLPDQKLPSSCLQPPNAAWDSRGDGAEPPKKVPYAILAVRTIADGQARRLDAFLQRCDELRVDQLDDLELVYRLDFQADAPSLPAPSLDEFLRLVQRGATALACEYVVRAPHILDEFLGRVLERTGTMSELLPRVAAALRDRPDARALLDQALWKQATQAIGSGQVSRARAVMETLYPRVQPRTPGAVFDRLLLEPPAGFRPGAISWPMRAYLLPHLAEAAGRGRSEGQHGLEPYLDVWLDAPPGQWERLLELDLPPFVRPRVGRACLRLSPGEIPDALGPYLAAGPPGQAPLLSMLAEAYTAAGAASRLAGRLFGAALAQPRSWGLLDDLLRREAELPSALVDDCLAAAPAALAELDLEGLLQAARDLPASGTAEPWSGLAAAVRNLSRRAGLPAAAAAPRPSLGRALDNWKELGRFLGGKPALDPESLRRLSQAVASQPRPVREALLRRMIPPLAQHLADAAGPFQDALEQIFAELGPFHAAGPHGLFRGVWLTLQESRPSALHRKVAPARDLIAAGLGARTNWPIAIHLPLEERERNAAIYDAVGELVRVVVPRNPQVAVELDSQAPLWASSQATSYWNRFSDIPRQRVGLRSRLGSLCDWWADFLEEALRGFPHV